MNASCYARRSGTRRLLSMLFLLLLASIVASSSSHSFTVSDDELIRLAVDSDVLFDEEEPMRYEKTSLLFVVIAARALVHRRNGFVDGGCLMISFSATVGCDGRGERGNVLK